MAPLTSHQIALQLKAFCMQQQFAQARKALFAMDATSIEADGKVYKGLKEIEQKHQGWMQSVELVRKLHIAKPLVNGNRIVLSFTWYITYKGAKETCWKEIGIFTLSEGKIKQEQFFYDI